MSDGKKLSNSAMGCFVMCILLFGAMTLIDLSSGVLFRFYARISCNHLITAIAKLLNLTKSIPVIRD
jgi:hypothetical protein